jgi:hypothetical protein
MTFESKTSEIINTNIDQQIKIQQQQQQQQDNPAVTKITTAPVNLHIPGSQNFHSENLENRGNLVQDQPPGIKSENPNNAGANSATPSTSQILRYKPLNSGDNSVNGGEKVAKKVSLPNYGKADNFVAILLKNGNFIRSSEFSNNPIWVPTNSKQSTKPEKNSSVSSNATDHSKENSDKYFLSHLLGDEAMPIDGDGKLKIDKYIAKLLSFDQKKWEKEIYEINPTSHGDKNFTWVWYSPENSLLVRFGIPKKGDAYGQRIEFYHFGFLDKFFNKIETLFGGFFNKIETSFVLLEEILSTIKTDKQKQDSDGITSQGISSNAPIVAENDIINGYEGELTEDDI